MEAALGIVQRWSGLYEEPADSSTMAFHDETTAQRLIALISLELALTPLAPEGVDTIIAPLMRSTAELLAKPNFHASGNNHGMFQDLALAYYAVMSSTDSLGIREDYFTTAMRRLKEYFSECFTAEGVHVENTPTYHLMVSRHVASVQRIAAAAGHEDAAYYATLISNAETYATHAIMPNGVYPPVSDTQQLDLSRSGMQSIFQSPEFAFASTQGRKGTKPKKRMLVLPKSGYAMYRSAWGDSASTFAFFSAAYNADYHKHSDDLSLFLRSGGVDLLSEAGPYGYNYQDPLTKYGFSQFSHNSLVVDGRSLPRTDAKKDKVTLTCTGERPDGFSVVGTNARYEDVVHQRVLNIREVEGVSELDVTDIITSENEHNYQLLWHLGTEVEVVTHGHGFELFHEGAKVLDLMVRANCPLRLSLHEGRMKPRPLGWRFPNFGEAVPTTTIALNFEGTNAELKTTIRLSGGCFNYVDRGLSGVDSEWQRFDAEIPVNYLLERAASARGKTRLVVIFSAINQPGDFTYNYKATVDEVDVNALYILDDFGDQGSYYHSDHGSEAIFRSVQRLISDVAKNLGIEADHIATAGSSKGGTAALIHGISLNVGRIIVGAPQTRIGSFVAEPHSNILEFMAGGTSAEDVQRLNSIVPEIARTVTPDSQIFILVGEKDHHLLNHVVPLVDGMTSTPNVTVLPNVTHGDIGRPFRLYLSASLEQWMEGQSEFFLPYALTEGEEVDSVRLRVYLPTNLQAAFSLFRGTELVEKIHYSANEVVAFNELEPGRYRVRIYCRSSSDRKTCAFTTRLINIASKDS
ncbi:hypothetical protein JOE65_002115 [Arthrobacter roseus]|nr:hypothetical protein [Arthrobacter roseus]